VNPFNRTRPLVVAVLLGIAVVATAVAPVRAKEAEADAPEAKKFGISRVVADDLLEAYALLEEEKVDEALAIVDELSERRRLKPPEQAQIHRFRAYIFVSKDQNEKATVEFERSLALQAMDPAAEQVMIYSLAQIYTELGRYDDALALMNRWFAAEQDPKADAYFLKAMILVQQENFRDAAEPADRALALSEKPKESWLTLHGVIHSQLKNYAKVEETLERLVEIAPKKTQYWMQLAAVQHHLGHEKEALATLQLGYQAGVVSADKDLRQLANLLLLGQQPYECAQVIEAGIARGAIEPDVDAYRLLSNCLIAARETEKAFAPLARGGELAPDGDMFILLGQMHLQRDRFADAIEALERALPKVKREQAGSVHLLMGIAQLGNEQLSDAERSFQLAVGDAKVNRAAESYLKLVEEKRLSQIQHHPAGSATGG